MSDTKTTDALAGVTVDTYAELAGSVRGCSIFLLDRAGRVASWNAGAARVMGYCAAEVMGRDFSLFYPEEARQRDQPRQELRLAEENGRFEDEGWRLSKDGRRFWASVVITALRDAQGGLQGFGTVTQDLSARREQEELLREAEERYRLLMEGVKDYAIVMLAPDGRVASWNSGAERIHGHGAAEIVGRHFSALYPQAAVDKKWPEQELGLAREHGRFEDNGVRVRKNGSTFWAHVAITPLYDAQGNQRGYAKIIRDLTERKRVEALEKAERQTNEFLATLAHEMRNPLAPISNALHLLAKRPPADDTERWVREVLHRQTAQLARLVEDLLDVSRVARTDIALSIGPHDLRPIVRAAHAAVMPELAARRQAVRLDLPEQELGVLGDAARLEQVMQSILLNAAKYAPEGVAFAVRARREGASIVVRVTDEAGLAPLRDPAADALGFALAQRLVAMHGGRVEVHGNGDGTGSELVVTLPASAAHALDRELTSPPRKRRMRVLVVDDNQDGANALRLLLEHDGHDVKTASDGITGLALARDYQPDFLLLDIGLPRLSGYDIAERLRSDPRMKELTIVAITGYGQVHDRARTAAVGFDYHLTKPVEFAALQALFDAKR